MDKTPVPVRLSSDQWEVRYRRMRTKWGECNLTDKIITIDPGTRKDNREREIALHEAIHALCPWMDEDWVAAMAIDLDDFLEALDL